MQTQNKIKPINIVVMLTMVFFVVFASSFKTVFNSTETVKKNTSQQLLEEDFNEKDVKLEKEVYQVYYLFQDLLREYYTCNSLNVVFHSPLKITSPYLKVRTPPPDFSPFS